MTVSVITYYPAVRRHIRQSDLVLPREDGIFSSHNGTAAGKSDNGGYPTFWDGRAWVRLHSYRDVLCCIS